MLSEREVQDVVNLLAQIAREGTDPQETFSELRAVGTYLEAGCGLEARKQVWDWINANHQILGAKMRAIQALAKGVA